MVHFAKVPYCPVPLGTVWYGLFSPHSLEVPVRLGAVEWRWACLGRVGFGVVSFTLVGLCRAWLGVVPLSVVRFGVVGLARAR